ncbi:MAG: alpha/beta fold hydrolase [Planctomycetaceae bacterium]|nr:alpha/beta fold hydrolase [Planctomycetaceae bacterium]
MSDAAELFGELPPFRPHMLLRSGHAQTLAATWCGQPKWEEQARQHLVLLPDADRIVLHEDLPSDRSAVNGSVKPAVLMLHGLGGCHRSPYMRWIGRKLNQSGFTTYRMDMRNCGAATGLSRFPYHAGRSDDIESAVRYIVQHCGQKQIIVTGFSLGGSILLNYLGTRPQDLAGEVLGGVAVCPPLRLEMCVTSIRRSLWGAYDRHFRRWLTRLVLAQIEQGTLATPPDRLALSRCRSLKEFDELYTAPAAGFGTADSYYSQCSCGDRLKAIRRPTLILTAADDPMVPAEQFEPFAGEQHLAVHVAEGGGHLGFLGRAGDDNDWRWMDWRVVDAVKRLAAASSRSRAAG